MAKKRKNPFRILLLIVLLVGCTFGGFLEAKAYGLSFFEEKEFTVSIDDQKDVEAMGGSFHNNDCFLIDDIELTSIGDLASSEFPYIATFDGQGHTIRLKGEVQKSLFGYIGKGGVVKNLTVIVEQATLKNNKFAALAIKNEGTIFNCKVVIENATIQKLGIYAGVAVYNDGLIKNVMAKCSFSKVLYLEEQAKDKIGGVKAGGVCAFNYGEVDSCVAVTGFNGFDETEKDGQYGSSESNSYIGALIGSDNGNGKVKNCLASVEENVYPSDQKNQGIDFLTEEELYSEERLFTQLNFDRKIWELTKYQGSYDFNLQEGEE